MRKSRGLSSGRKAALKLLQVRPVASFGDAQAADMETVRAGLSTELVSSESALGNGFFTESSFIVVIPPDSFDKMETGRMAAEISEINSRIQAEGESYFLIGPGRWGSSIPTLGVPVAWTDISAARMVVEYGMDGFRIDPSQGTHFFQNITSLGVGYLSVDSYAGKGDVFFEKIASFECVFKGSFARVYRIPGLTGFIDRNKGLAVIGA